MFISVGRSRKFTSGKLLDNHEGGGMCTYPSEVYHREHSLWEFPNFVPKFCPSDTSPVVVVEFP